MVVCAVIKYKDGRARSYYLQVQSIFLGPTLRIV